MEGAILGNTIVVDLVRVVFRCWMAERLVLFVIIYDNGLALTSCLLVETNPLCWGASHVMLVTVRRAPKSGRRRTADEAGRASSTVF